MSRAGILHRPVADTPIAILDFETTGLTPGIDRVVEVSVVRKEPGQSPQMVFDTLINPGRPMGATEIHGITDEDVSDAPRFEEIASSFVDAISGCAVAAYNVYFDIRFSDYELGQVGIGNQPPHFCLMYLRPMLGIGRRCRLSEACAHHGLSFEDQHITSSDCHAAAQLLEVYSEAMRSVGVVTFEDLASRRAYKFTTSFGNAPFTTTLCDTGIGKARIKPRGCPGRSAPSANISVDSGDAPGEPMQGLRAYWGTLRDAVTDLEMSDAELLDLAARRFESNLSEEQVRALHTKIYMSVLAEYAKDWRINSEEREVLRRLHSCLRAAGWAPGD